MEEVNGRIGKKGSCEAEGAGNKYGEKRKREAAPPLVTAERQHDIIDGLSNQLATVPVEDLLKPEHKYVALIYGTPEAEGENRHEAAVGAVSRQLATHRVGVVGVDCETCEIPQALDQVEDSAP